MSERTDSPASKQADSAVCSQQTSLQNRSAHEVARANGVVYEFNVRVQTRDGTLLSTDIYRPNAPGKWPVLLIRTPYTKDTASWRPRDRAAACDQCRWMVPSLTPHMPRTYWSIRDRGAPRMEVGAGSAHLLADVICRDFPSIDWAPFLCHRLSRLSESTT
jgi:hypothetical protein